jgi:hypothetical protein
MGEILIAIAMWCKSDPYPFKTVRQCKFETLECVKANQNWSRCFEQPEELPWPNFNKEKAR